ncbi:hypothetical protein GCM10009740_06240 [Terrabacter terrae]|uniref:Glutamyl-tRNA amidotransferase n=1 Tax=Terrabacter terrae TaxID=318434 RepID=A0ABP5FDD2_9MICO
MSSTLRLLLRARLTAAMRERDRCAVGVLRSAVAAIENAEAVPVPGTSAAGSVPSGSVWSGSSSSGDVALAAVGLGATEAERRRLDHAAERAVVVAEVRSLLEARTVYAAAGQGDRAGAAAVGAELLTDVLEEADRVHGTDGALDTGPTPA